MIQEMKKLTFLVTNGEYEKFIANIRELGVIHVEELQQGATSDELQAGLDMAVRYKEALKALDFAAESYEPSATYMPQPADASKAVVLLDTVERLLKEENSVKHSIDATDDAIQQLEPFGEFSWDSIRQLEQSGYKPYFYAVNNKMYKAEWGEKYFATAIDEINKKTYFVAFSNEDQEPDITAERLFLPDESLSVYQEKRKVLEEQLVSIHEQMLQVNAVDRASIEAGQVANENDIQLSKVHLSKEDIAGGAVKLMVGWTLKEKADGVVDYLEKEHIFYELEDPAFDDNVPIQIKNDKFSSLFEPILRMYSLPNYHDIDPLPFFAPFFMLFFGLCMGDMGYGLLILAASIAIIFTKPDLAKYGKLGALLGGMTCICGFITGTFFGIDLATVDWEFIKPMQPYFINDSMKDSFFGYSPMMVISVIIGLIQVLLGMTLAGCKAVKNYGFVYGVGKFSWVVALLSATLLFGFPLFGVEWSHPVQYVFYALIALSALGIFFLNNPNAYKKDSALGKALGVGSNIGGGIWATYGMSTGLLGDLLSYIRLFALGLTGGVLGSVFNQLAMEMSPDVPVVHELVMLIILLFGHGINFGLCMISSFVHPMRLTFVEYFKNADFEGNGKEYNPFQVKVK
ncbi:MAG: V-type ATPase 116kDa subunit family protein [Bacteroidaceae bacterium]|nr:V-type ATPase 116kDa subunit family protein [Prevotellaceae bacterium]MDY5759749.1 V-type ATPase 116kDa subunit family protein [Bacteroidaceae bacterium]